MASALTSVREIERRVTALRADPDSEQPYQRTSVMTHIAWVPEKWEEAAEDVLAGLAEGHPSRTIVLLPRPHAGDGLDAEVDMEVFPVGDGRQICTETIRVHLNGPRAAEPASVVQPLFLADLPVFLRWRGVPCYGETSFEGLVEVADRLIVDSTEWDDLPGSYAGLAGVFDRITVSDIAWARTSRWRPQLASLWPEIGNVKTLRVEGTAAQAHLLAGWLRTRLDRPVELEHEAAQRLTSVDINGEPVPFPPNDPPVPAVLLSDELDRFTRDRVYEDAVRGALL
jgi:glucose-6-phosphate dehydrogenase assembly protein OpcA